MTKRTRMSKWQFGLAFWRQDGKCSCGCNEELREGETDEEHSVPFYFTGAPPDAIMLRGHHIAKTAKDKGDIAKAKRRAGITGQQARRARNGPKLKSPKRKMQGPQFDKTLTKGFDGKVRKRNE